MKVYVTRGPFLGNPTNNEWLIGPAGAFKVGDEVEIPDRPRRFGLERPGCPKARVTQIDEDGLARAVDVRELDKEIVSDRYAAAA